MLAGTGGQRLSPLLIHDSGQATDGAPWETGGAP